MSKSPASLFLTAFFASALVVSGTLLLLQATVKWGAPNIEVEDPIIARAGSGSLSARVASGVPSRQEQERPSLSSIASPPATAAQPDYTGSVPDEPEAVVYPSAGNEIAMPSSEHGRVPAPSDTGPPDIAAEPEGGPASVNASPDLTPDSTLVSESPPDRSAPVQVVDEAVSTQIPEDSASDQAEEEIASREEAPVEPISEGVSDHLATEEEAQNAGPTVPLPQRRPVQSAAPASEPVARSGQRDYASLPSKPLRKAMTLAPNKLAATPPRQAKRPNTTSYNSKVWSALARHKPRTGRRGSTSVTFGIGAKGELRFARVSGSSGNPKLDQLALATVRNAAPFPSPPKGAQSYTIRIHFR
jgi:protein TonB